MVDVVFADVAQPDQARIVALNAHNFLRNQGHFVISIKVSQSLNYCVIIIITDIIIDRLIVWTVLLNLPRYLPAK